MRRASWILLGLALGCAPPRPAVPEVRVPSAPPWRLGDALLADGRCTEAISEYSRSLLEPLEANDEARIRLFRALARLDCGPSPSTQLAFEELRKLEREDAASVWSRLARLFVDELLRQEALRKDISRLEVAKVELSTRVTELQTELEETGATKDSLQGQLSVARDDRRKVQAALEEAITAKQALQQRVDELTEELAGLKKIDMERDL